MRPVSSAAVAAAAVIIAGAAGCARHTNPGLGDVGPPLIVCGMVLAPGGGESVHVLDLHPVASGGPVSYAPERSALPPEGPFPAGSAVGIVPVVVITARDCARAPVITVEPASAARTVAIARGANGGIAGIALATLPVTTTIRAYRGHRLIGQLTLLRGVPTVSDP
jgi:hypothetical protein